MGCSSVKLPPIAYATSNTSLDHHMAVLWVHVSLQAGGTSDIVFYCSSLGLARTICTCTMYIHKAYHVYTQGVPCIYTRCTICIYTRCTICIYTRCTICIYTKVPCIYTRCTMYIHKAYHAYTQGVPCIYTRCTMYIHKVHHAYTLGVPCIYTRCTIRIYTRYMYIHKVHVYTPRYHVYTQGVPHVHV